MNTPSRKSDENDKDQMTNDKKHKVHDLHARTEDFAMAAIHFFTRLKRNDDVCMVLGRQMLRSATSVGANYKEADHARSRAEFKAKIGECLKEAAETKYWLILFSRHHCLDHDLPRILDEAGQLEKIFHTIDHSKF